jgi:carboxylesterase
MDTNNNALHTLQNSSRQLFAGDQHQPFHWNGGQPAAVLIHGFMGTPDELRPLAQELHEAGWTVKGVLLPGFGEQIDTLFTRQWSDWKAAVQETILELQQQHRPIILVGYSMGAAVALNAAADTVVDGLVLIAPFWQIGTAWQRMVWQLLKHIFPQFQPFKRVDFSNPQLVEFFVKMMPELDLTDPSVQETLRQLRVPARFVDQVFDIGKAAEKVAADIQAPIHIIQGLEDETVMPERTRQLLQRFAGPITYEEVEADHDLVKPNNPGFYYTAQSLLTHVQRMALIKQNGLAFP